MSKAKHDTLSRYRTEQRSFVKSYGALVILSVVLWTVSRAPTLISDVNIGNLKLNINVGYVVVFGPPLLLALTLWRWWESRHVAEVRQELGLTVAKRGLGNWASLLFFVFPGIACFVLLRQFVLETTEPGTKCDDFDHLRLFWDMSLFSSRGWKFAYCFGFENGSDEQRLMPYMFPPLQTWAYLIFSFVTVWLGVLIWRNVTGELSPVGRATPARPAKATQKTTS